ncbi:MAG: phage terminase large subunit family protein [Bacteroidales bacterium]|nr:phage terminase large subunit family protein [Bacteroidales bacterium]
MATIDEIERRALAALRPPPKLRLSEWIEANIYLPGDVSSLPGLVKLWPFQRQIADAIGDPAIERMTLIKPTRVGFTLLITSALGAFIANEPSPILVLLPTESDARDYMVSEIEPIFAESPALADVLGQAGARAGRDTILHRKFPGGSLKVVAAKAPRNLRRHTARVLLIDEVDGMEQTVEGPPVLLAERRTLSFADRKIILGSTPTHEDTSQVMRSYEQSDQRIYEVPCPGCGDFHEIRWKDIVWPKDRPQDAHWVCPGCGSVVEERQKVEMVEAGRWRATAPHVEGHAGFRMSALISVLPNASWAKLAAEFVAANEDKDPGALQVFTNTALGEPWRGPGEEIDDAALAARAEAFSLDLVPAEVLAITLGVDVQRDRLEATVLGWAEDGTAFVLGHHVVWGLPEHDGTWAELDELLKMRWPHELGGKIGVDAVAIDSGDGETMEAVYRFAFPRASRRVLAIKGAAGNRPFIERSSQKIRGGALWVVGVDGIKSHLDARLKRGNSIRFASTLPAVWFEQLASERVVVRYSKGQPQRRFERIPGRRAEALDCVVYGIAARQLLNVNWSARAEVLKNATLAAPPPARPRVIKSSWMER